MSTGEDRHIGATPIHLLAATVLALVPVLAEAQGQGEPYIVLPGDTLSSISASTGCTVTEIREANALTGDRIDADDELTIPKCANRPRASSKTRAPRSGWMPKKALPQLMKARGFQPPEKFMALVVEVTFNKKRDRIVRERWFPYRDTASQVWGWNPASTVKVYPAIAAVQYLRSLGFTTEARVTFSTKSGDHQFKVKELIEAALIPSDNLAYNWLSVFVGFDRLNRDFFSERNGFLDTFLARPYAAEKWKALGGEESLRSSPPITIQEGRKTHRIENRRGRYRNEGQSAGTSLRDLTEAMRRLMLQEQLRPKDSFRLKRDELIRIRRALRGFRKRGEEVINNLDRVLADERIFFYHKAGFSRDWYSDTVYFAIPRGRKAWIVTLAGYPGRGSLNEAARIVGELIKSGDLSRY